MYDIATNVVPVTFVHVADLGLHILNYQGCLIFSNMVVKMHFQYTKLLNINIRSQLLTNFMYTEPVMNLSLTRVFIISNRS